MDIKIENSWKQLLEKEFQKEYFKDLVHFLKNEYSKKIIYPPGKLIFKSFNNCPFNELKVVIIGQDPYHGYNQANGLCFSVNKGIKNKDDLAELSIDVLQEIIEISEDDASKMIMKAREHWFN